MEISFSKFNKSILAGICISIATMTYLSIPNKIIGSLFFSFGLLTILIYKLNLFTGMVGYLGKDFSIIDLMIVFFGNFVGCLIFGKVVNLSSEKFQNIISMSVEVFSDKILIISYDLFGVFLASFLCGILMFIAVDVWKNISIDEILKTIIVTLCVSIFITIGAEHVIANLSFMFLSNFDKLSNVNFYNILLFFIFCLFGNSLGSIFVYKITRSWK